MTLTRSGRPNNSGTRGGVPSAGILPLASEEYDPDNEQQFRRQLEEILTPLRDFLGKFSSETTTGLDAVAAAEFLVAAASSALTAERLVVDTLRIAWSFATPGQASADVVADSISDTLLRNSAALSVIGRAANTLGDPADIVAALDGEVLRRAGTALGFGQVATAGIADNAVTQLKVADNAVTQLKVADNAIGNPELTDMAAWTIKMRNVGTLGDPQDQTINDLTEETSLDGIADFLPLWDASGAVMRKGKPTNLTRAGGLQLLTFGTVAAAASLDIVLTGYTGYRGLIFKLYGCRPATDGAILWTRFSTDAGSTYDTTSYNYTLMGTNDTPASAAQGSGSAAQIALSGATGVGNLSTECANVTIELLNQTATAFWPQIMWHAAVIGIAPNGNMHIGAGAREVAQDVDAVRFLFSTGNITEAGYAVYGLI